MYHQRVGRDSLMIMPIFFQRDFRTKLKEWWKEVASVQWIDRWFQDEVRHLCCRNGRRSNIIVLNKVVRGRIWIERNIHNGGRQHVANGRIDAIRKTLDLEGLKVGPY